MEYRLTEDWKDIKEIIKQDIIDILKEVGKEKK